MTYQSLGQSQWGFHDSSFQRIHILETVQKSFISTKLSHETFIISFLKYGATSAY